MITLQEMTVFNSLYWKRLRLINWGAVVWWVYSSDKPHGAKETRVRILPDHASFVKKELEWKRHLLATALPTVWKVSPTLSFFANLDSRNQKPAGGRESMASEEMKRCGRADARIRKFEFKSKEAQSSTSKHSKKCSRGRRSERMSGRLYLWMERKMDMRKEKPGSLWRRLNG